jgi:hypothetical protein
MSEANETDELLSDGARRRYLAGLRTRRVAPDASALKALPTLDELLPRAECARGVSVWNAGTSGRLSGRTESRGSVVRELCGDGCGRGPTSHNGPTRICLIL